MSEEVTNFLKQVRELGDRRIEEDEARSRELEEKILQEKKERQARRAERARSISPQKSSPANTPPPSAGGTSQILDGASLLATSSPALDSLSNPYPSSRGDHEPHNPTMDPPLSTSPTKENESPFDSDLKRSTFSGSSQARASHLSWQRRPNSQIGSRSRPLSMVAAENAAVRSNNHSPTPDDSSISKDQISNALSSKDPAWFRQTADRGHDSAAFRGSQVEDTERLDMSSLKTQVPGMSRDSSAEPQKDEHIQAVESPAVRTNPVSSFPLTPSQRLGPPSSAPQSAVADDTPHSPSLPGSGRTSPVRSTSPTKGIGGFVQSAMMKRSDSVNKRWSVQSPPGLARAGSIATNRHSRGVGQMHNSKPSLSSRPVSMIQSPSTLSADFKPSSSNEPEEPQESGSRPGETSAKSISIDTSVTSGEEDTGDKNTEHKTPPASPSKTIDQRRWSPTKASWLESALSKPESPKPKPAPPVSQQPSWMVELNKAKAQKANNPSVDLGKSGSTSSHKHAVNTGGLMRAPPLGANVKPPSTISGLEGIASAKAASVQTSVGSLRGNLKKAAPPPPPAKPTGQGSEVDDVDAKIATPGNKQKPETPPKKDFRANLKHRSAAEALAAKNSKQPANELKNVFGNLRRTTTQKHVPADKFKDNLLRGKAALNATGGPKMSERRDELKDAILRKKEEFKKAQLEGRSVTKKPSNIGDNTALPEGQAKRAALGQSLTGSSTAAQGAGEAPDSKRPDALSQRTSSDPLSTITSSKPSEAPVSGLNRVSTLEATRSPSSGHSVALETKQVLDSRPTHVAARPTTASPQPTPSLRKETSTATRPQIKTTVSSGSLADRFNPALAGLLARGPLVSGSGPSDGGNSTSQPGPQTQSSAEPNGPRPQLTHMTKHRARGPRRKAPSSNTETAKKVDKPVSENGPSSTAPPKPSAAEMRPDSLNLTEDPSPSIAPQQKVQAAQLPPLAFDVKSSKMPPPSKPTALSSVVPLVDSSRKVVGDKPQPKGERIDLVDPPKPNLTPESSSQGQEMEPAQISIASIHEQVAIAAAAKKGMPPPKRLLEEKTGEKTVQPPSPKKLDMSRMFKFDIPEAEPPKPVEHLWSDPQPAIRPKPVIGRTVSPIRGDLTPKTPETTKSQPPRPLPEPVVSQKAVEPIDTSKPARSLPDPVVPPRTLEPTVDVVQESGTSRVKPPPMLSPRPLPTAPVAGNPVSSPPHSRSPTRSPRRQSPDIAGMLSNFFGARRPNREYLVDTGGVLASKPKTQGRIQTLKAQLFQISNTGKKQPVPTHHERVLFEREMYLCPHTYQNEARKKVTEVYFWAGDEVPVSVVEDAEIFVNKEARAMGGKLCKMQQGKETPEFIQALGGIVIIRRGSSNKYDSLAPNMLCGRRHLGQIIFDEVDFSASNLCSGFPFLITQQARCFLWKGKGSDVDELSCARLIGMDLTLTGELDEIDDGAEPPSFWQIFDGRSRTGSADHWRLKPNYQRYGARLFCSDSSSTNQQIYEISPFSQTDLSSSHIYIMDAFFELYILVGVRAQAEYVSFHNALDFAQEYAILASSMEDRPFVPVSTVVLEGIPRDLKSVFRKWRDSHSITTHAQPQGAVSPGLRRGRSLRIVPLNMALQALSD
ncbi:putative gelsolin repeat protein [Zalerion maritima]|uniref:Gelsolin repeat protein n=1 Tax=Zalerion maritima TaxID=339359 RepID=A0AAD5RMA3_9PEZI|nr:putative gelsolin repeat protein [Zalerion maritima]